MARMFTEATDVVALRLLRKTGATIERRSSMLVYEGEKKNFSESHRIDLSDERMVIVVNVTVIVVVRSAPLRSAPLTTLMTMRMMLLSSMK